MLRVPYALLLITAVAVTGCASLPKEPTRRAPRGVITREAMDRMKVGTAYEVVARKLNRPLSLGVRGGATSFEQSQEPIVVVDGIRSEFTVLHTLPKFDLESIEILNAVDGTLRYGTGATNGVIVIKTNKGR